MNKGFSKIILISGVVFVLLVIGALTKINNKRPQTVVKNDQSVVDTSVDWIDVHTHCGKTSEDLDLIKREIQGVIEKYNISSSGQLKTNKEALNEVSEFYIDIQDTRCNDADGWKNVNKEAGPGQAVLLTTAYTVIQDFDSSFAEVIDTAGHVLSENVQNLAATDDSILLFATLDCLYDTPFSDPNWAKECKKDADYWVGQGAVGFKDYVGGNEMDSWNYFNDLCESSENCITEPTVKYLLIEPAWRDVVKYVVEEKKVPIVSHAIYNQFTGKECYDPFMGTTRDCGAATIDHLIDFAKWAEKNISDKARRRFIVAHMALMLPGRHHDRPEKLPELLEYGVSVDTSATLDNMVPMACEIRELIGKFPNQIMFGTDKSLSDAEGSSCTPSVYEAYLHFFNAPFGEEQKFGSCVFDGLIVPGLGLDDQVVSGCNAQVGPTARADVLKDNFISLYD